MGVIDFKKIYNTHSSANFENSPVTILKSETNDIFKIRHLKVRNRKLSRCYRYNFITTLAVPANATLFARLSKCHLQQSECLAFLLAFCLCPAMVLTIFSDFAVLIALKTMPSAHAHILLMVSALPARTSAVATRQAVSVSVADGAVIVRQKRGRTKCCEGDIVVPPKKS